MSGQASPDPPPDGPTEEDLLARAAAQGIHRLAIPTPFMVGRVNAYLIEDFVAAAFHVLG